MDALFDALDIGSVLTLHKSRNKIPYDLVGLTKLLVIGRMRSPASKISTYENKDNYLMSLADSSNWHEIYKCLDELDKKSEAIQKRMNQKLTKETGKRGEITYYDVTNYFFEIEQNDEDIFDEHGILLKKGLRKKGVCKHNRKTPIVQMGMFLDAHGIPVSYHLFPGNTFDQATLRPAMKKTIDQYNLKKIIIVAHFLICFIALLMMRLIQNTVVDSTGASTKSAFDWEAGLSAKRVQAALKEYSAIEIPQGYFLTTRVTEDLKTITRALGIEKDLRLPTLSELKQYRFDIRKKLII